MLAKKADLLVNYKETEGEKDAQLLLAFETYQLLARLIQFSRSSFKADESKLLLSINTVPIYEKAIALSLGLYNSSHNSQYLEEAYYYFELSKAALLAETLQTDLAQQTHQLPLALLEAMNEGVPVLTSNIPVHQRLVGSDRGQLFRVNDLNHCVNQLEWCLDNISEMKDRAEQAQQYIHTNHSWDKITDMLLDLYDKRALQAPVPAPASSRDSEASSPLANGVGPSSR